MSIKTEIDRIKQSKADIISALETKGVTVPSDASIDDLSALVDAIEVASDPVLQSKTVSPTTSKQTITPDTGYDGLSQVTVSAVTSSIDSDIKASNIKKGVNILGVTGTLESGITPTGTMSITSNGTYDVTNYASASVNVSGGGSGGASIDTCTVKISCYPDYGAYVMAFSAMVWDGEKIAIVTDGDTTKAEFTIENVICGSIISFRSSASFNRGYSTNVEHLPSASSGYYVNTAAKIVAPSGGNAVLAITPTG